jgi:hypothetical protein
MFFFTPVIGVFVYHECTMRWHAEMGDVLTGKLLKKNVEYTNQILFHLNQDPADCQFSRKKKTGFTDLWPIRHQQNKT